MQSSDRYRCEGCGFYRDAAPLGHDVCNVHLRHLLAEHPHAVRLQSSRSTEVSNLGMALVLSVCEELGKFRQPRGFIWASRGAS